MKRFERLPAPAILLDNWEIWGDDYAQKKAAKPRYTFQWKKPKGQAKVNHQILGLLKEQTQEHCS